MSQRNFFPCYISCINAGVKAPKIVSHFGIYGPPEVDQIEPQTAKFGPKCDTESCHETKD